MVAPSQRGDRRVRRASLRVPDAAVRARTEFALCEALRLVRLAGEDEGRIYYFRSVSLAGLDVDANRRTWQAQLQRALDRLAQHAVHGTDWHAGAADAVYFRSRQEAFEVLLRALVRGAARTEWFWPLVSSALADAGPSASLVAVVDGLRAESGGWCRVAQTVFALGADGDPLTLIEALPPNAAAVWLREFGAGRADDASAVAVPMVPHARAVLARARATLGARDPRVVWLAVLAVALTSPIIFESGFVVQRAHATLRHLAPNGSGAAAVSRPFERGPLSRANAAIRPPATIEFADVEFLGAAAITEHDRHALREHRNTEPPVAVDGAMLEPALGEPTQAAGFFFLLNALMRLGLGRAAQADPERVAIGSVALLLIRLAVHAGIDPADATFRWIETLADARLAREASDPCQRALVRHWSRAVRRWCRRASGMSVREIAQRGGRIVSSRTDLDIVLALDRADIRIRRAGLDIDPGWLPWFGRVVRFHYVRFDSEAAPV